MALPKASILFVENSGKLVGGGQFSVLGLANGLKHKGYVVNFILPEKEDFYHVLVKNGFEPIISNVNSFRGFNVLKLPVAVLSIRRIIKKLNVDIVHSNSPRAALLAGFASLFTKTKSVWHLRVPGDTCLLDFITTVLSTKIIAISNHVSNRIKNKNKVVVIHNGIVIPKKESPELINKLRTELGFSDSLIVGTAGQLVPSKGFDAFIKTAKLVLQEFPNAEFIILGREVEWQKGYKQKLEDLSKSLNIEKKIHFLGFKENIFSYYRIMDVFSFFTKLEAFGRVVAESMLAGVPVVSSNTGGIPEIIDNNENGFLFDVNDINLAANKIILLLRSKELRKIIGNKGREKINKYFLMDSHVEKICNFYDDLLNKEIL